jgi:hypothetical protein
LVVINEVCYDPEGADSGKEWIELYNSGETDVDLEGALLLKGGSDFQIVYEFPHFILRAHRFLLIGETQVSQAVLITTLGLQNGGSETDGIRFVSPDGQYTDTVLYDSPNLNGLPDDTGGEGDSFALDVPEGYSLARIIDGQDSNACEIDFLAEQNSTPGLPNHVYVDYALVNPEVWQEGASWMFGVWVKNLSGLSPDVSAELSILLDGIKITEHYVTGLCAGDSVLVEDTLPVSDGGNHIVEAILDLADDPDPDNNHVSIELWGQEGSTIVINEVMFDPGADGQEWIEVYVSGSSSGVVHIMRDVAGNEFQFSLPTSSGHYVLCSSGEQLLLDYPDCPATAVVEVSGWAPLNNTGDSIILLDADGETIDQMSYTGIEGRQGVSLERFLNSQQEAGWRYCLDPEGATPGRENSQSAPVPDFDGILNIEGSPCAPSHGEAISIYYRLESEQSQVNCRVYDRAGRRVGILAENLLVPSEGMIVWDGRDSKGSLLPRGLYFIDWESRSVSGSKSLKRQRSVVIYD